MSKIQAPYGSWVSPISAADLAASEHPVTSARYVNDEIWWSELVPAEGGRYSIRRQGDYATVEDLLPEPWNARTRVHEYGGGAWTVWADTAGSTPSTSRQNSRNPNTSTQNQRTPELIFVEFSDQRLYKMRIGQVPRPLTPADGGMRFADIQCVSLGDTGEMQGTGSTSEYVLAVREMHGLGGITRDIVLVPLDGSGARDADKIISLVSGSDFLAAPRLSPRGRRLAWVAWDHPDMPWDASEVRVGEISVRSDYPVAFDARTVLGGRSNSAGRSVEGLPTTANTSTPANISSTQPVSVLQPEWIDESNLYAIADDTGWWNLKHVQIEPTVTVRNIEELEKEVGGPAWVFGQTWYRELTGGALLHVRTFGSDELAVVDPMTKDSARVPTPFQHIQICDVKDEKVLLIGGSARLESGLREFDLATGELNVVRLGSDLEIDVEYIPACEQRVFRASTNSSTNAGPTGLTNDYNNPREVHALVYPPTNPHYEGTLGERPPFVAFVHGGPTAHAKPKLSALIAYFTSRGIGVVDINYGGSTGYGRAYRERLRGQWGVVDVQDVATVMRSLAEQGVADAGRLAIRGGSAGGWTVLSALTASDPHVAGVFTAGVSFFGVAELERFVEDTHDFESRYIDGLIGPLPEARELYVSRAPINNTDALTCPVLLLQGSDDLIVPPSQAQMFVDALRDKGLTYGYVEYEGESHGFRRRESIVHATEAELSFYGQVLGFEPADVERFPLENM